MQKNVKTGNLPPGFGNIGGRRPGRPIGNPGPGEGHGEMCDVGVVVDVVDDEELAAAAAAAAMATIPARKGGCRKTGDSCSRCYKTFSWSLAKRDRWS